MVGKKENFLQGLQNLGLDKDQITVYLFLMKTGIQTALQISRQVKMPRTRVYRVLQSLIEKDYIHYHVDSRGGKYQAAPPASLKNTIDKEQARISLQAQQLQALIPQLEAINQAQSQQAQMMVYRGVAGSKQIIDTVAKAEHDCFCIIDLITSKDGFANMLISALQKRQKKYADVVYVYKNHSTFLQLPHFYHSQKPGYDLICLPDQVIFVYIKDNELFFAVLYNKQISRHTAVVYKQMLAGLA